MGFMHTVSVHEAKTHLSRLLREVAAGKEIVITKSGKPVARLSGPAEPKKRRSPGLFKGKIHIPADFDAPMPDEWFFPDEDKFSR